MLLLQLDEDYYRLTEEGKEQDEDPEEVEYGTAAYYKAGDGTCYVAYIEDGNDESQFTVYRLGDAVPEVTIEDVTFDRPGEEEEEEEEEEEGDGEVEPGEPGELEPEEEEEEDLDLK